MKKYVVLLVVLLFPRISTAHTRLTMSSGQNPKWASMPVPYWIQDKGLPGISNGSDFAAVQASFQTWQNIPTTSIQFAYKGTTAAGTVGLDGMNLVTFTDTTAPLGTSVIAATFSFFKTENGALLFDEADIAFNPALAFSTSAETGKFDIQSVLTHEIGHFLGLDHSALISSVMVPFGVPSQLDQRTLAYDDIAGVMEIYPNLSATPPTGQIQGTIQSSGDGVFGAHVIAIGSSGTAVSSTLSQKDGSYTLQFLPPDTYRIAVEPLDGPVTVQNIGGTNGFYGSSNTNFGTTYSGNVSTLTEAALVDVAPGQTATADIKILPASTSGLNLTRPAFGIRIPAGQTALSGVIGGVDLSSGVVFSASDPSIQFGAITFGGPISSTAPSSVSVPITILPTAVPGPKILAVNRGTDASIAAGAFVITDIRPSSISVLPSNGPVEGGTLVTIRGTGFRPGVQVYFAGSVCANIQVVDSKTITATTPVNDPGLTNIVVVNMDGTWGAGQQLFTYVAQPPTISGISPLSGPSGTQVLIQGDHFDSRIENIAVQFNGTSARVISAGPNAITAVVPFSATSGPLSVAVFGQVAAGPVFTVGASPISSNFAGPTFNFTDASAQNGGTALTFSSNDDAIAVVNLPFDFVLFKDIYPAGSRISVAVNGYLSLETLSIDEFQNASLPSKTVTRTGAAAGSFGTVPPSLIAPFWEDLVMHSNSAITTKTLGAAPNRQFVVEWSNLSILDQFGTDQNASLTFEAVLYEGSNDVQFLYRGVSGPRSNGSSATVGMQNFERDTAVQTGFDQAIISSGYFKTYHFQNGTYSDSLPAVTSPVEVRIIPSAPQDGTTFTGIALISQEAMTVSLSAFDNSGNLVSGAGIHNPITIALAANQEYTKLVSELFGLPSFDGWIEADASTTGLNIFLASGSADIQHLDGAAVTDLSSDFLLFHAGASAILVNPSPRTANVTLSGLGTGTTQSIAIGPRNRLLTTIAGVTRFQSSEALSAIERLAAPGGLTSNAAVPLSQAQANTVFPDAVVGDGYSSILTIANTAALQQTLTVSLGTTNATLSINPNAVIRTSISDLLHISQNAVIAGALRVNAGSAPVFGVLDIVDSNDSAITPARSAASNFTLPNVANGNGFFTGLALASGSESANSTLEVHDAAGNLVGSATINLTANQQLSRLLSELVPAAANQMGGYILIRSDHPIWVWEVFGSSQAIASAPPL